MSPPTPDTADVVMYDADENQIAELVKFTLFPKLPKELRLQIVEAAVGGVDPRTFVVAFTSNYVVGGRSTTTNRVRGCKFLMNTKVFPVPAILQVNAESRRVALKSYHLSFSGPLNDRPIYFDFAKDKLAFKTQEAFTRMKDASSASAWKKLEEKLQFLVVGEELYGEDSVLRDVASFHKLKVFVHQNQEESRAAWLNNTQANARLKLVLEGNWTKSQEYEELVAAADREANLIPEPVMKKVYYLPKIEILSIKDIGLILKEN